MIRIVTRNSQLALCQTDLVVKALEAYWPQESFKVLPILSEGDTHSGRITGKTVFVKALERQLLSDFADIAVHSLKDMSASATDGLSIPAVLQRAEARDVLVSYDYPDLNSMPAGSILGTSSPRRAAQIKTFHPRLNILPCRGNLIRRLEKLKQGHFQGLLLAGAGLERLNMHSYISEYLPLEQVIPCPGQGVIAVQCRTHDSNIQTILQKINHAPSYQLQSIERTLARKLGINCATPVGIYARFLKDQRIELNFYLNLIEDSHNLYRKTLIDPQSPESLEQQLQLFYEALMDENVDEIIGYFSQSKS